MKSTLAVALSVMFLLSPPLVAAEVDPEALIQQAKNIAPPDGDDAFWMIRSREAAAGGATEAIETLMERFSLDRHEVISRLAARMSTIPFGLSPTEPRDNAAAFRIALHAERDIVEILGIALAPLAGYGSGDSALTLNYCRPAEDFFVNLAGFAEDVAGPEGTEFKYRLYSMVGQIAIHWNEIDIAAAIIAKIMTLGEVENKTDHLLRSLAITANLVGRVLLSDEPLALRALHSAVLNQDVSDRSRRILNGLFTATAEAAKTLRSDQPYDRSGKAFRNAYTVLSEEPDVDRQIRAATAGLRRSLSAIALIATEADPIAFLGMFDQIDEQVDLIGTTAEAIVKLISGGHIDQVILLSQVVLSTNVDSHVLKEVTWGIRRGIAISVAVKASENVKEAMELFDRFTSNPHLEPFHADIYIDSLPRLLVARGSMGSEWLQDHPLDLERHDFTELVSPLFTAIGLSFAEGAEGAVEMVKLIEDPEIRSKALAEIGYVAMLREESCAKGPPPIRAVVDEIEVVDATTILVDGQPLRLVGYAAPSEDGQCQAETILGRTASQRVRDLFAEKGPATIEGRGHQGGTAHAHATIGQQTLAELLIKDNLAIPHQCDGECPRVEWCR